jgi:SpoVK/Ycf46/Vps4 family AAA+-type ATPase
MIMMRRKLDNPKPLSTDISLEDIAKTLEKYSGADIPRISEKACDIPFVESVKTGADRNVEKRDIFGVIQVVKPSVSSKTLDRFEKFVLTDSM